MNLPIPRTGLGSVAGASLLSFALVTSAAAQVATLADPGEDDEATAVPVAEELAGEEAMLEWAQCMRDNGIDMDDPQFGVDGARLGFGGGPGAEEPFDFESSEFQSAMEACDGLLEAMRPETDVEQEAEQAEQLLVLAECMRERDWDFPDPSSTGDLRMTIRESDLDFGDPAFQTDMTECSADSGMEFGNPG